MNTEAVDTKVTADVPAENAFQKEAYRVKCETRMIIENVFLTSPSWECCPVCGRTKKECNFVYSRATF